MFKNSHFFKTGLRALARFLVLSLIIVSFSTQSQAFGDNESKNNFFFGAPAILHIKSGNHSLEVDWTPVALAKSYKFFYGTSSGVYGAPVIVKNGSEYTLTGLKAGTTYYLAVLAVTTKGETPKSYERSASTLPDPPSAPVLNSAVGGNHQVTLSWNQVNAAKFYRIYYRSTGFEFARFSDADDFKSFTVRGLKSGTTYYFKVSAVNGGGESAKSNEKSALTLPGVPHIVSAVGGNNSVTLAWKGVKSAATYKIYISKSVKVPGEPIDAGNVEKYTVTGLDANTKYFFRVAAVNSTGEGKKSFPREAKTLSTTISAPVLTDANGGLKQVSLKWGAVSGATSYKVYFGTASGNYVNSSNAGNVTQFTVTGLNDGTLYYFAVTALDANSESPKSNEKSATTFSLPTATISVTPASIIQGNSATLSWQCTNADTCSISPDIGTVENSGTKSISPSATTTYTITATGPGGTASNTTTLTVYIPPTATISVTPASIIQGNSATLSWQCTNADTCSISPDIGTVAMNGAMPVSPTATTTYTLTATGPGGTVSNTATLTVNIPPTASISVDPASITQGQSATLTWQCANADSCTITPDIGTVAMSGTMSVSPSSTTTYTVVATSSYGTDTKSSTLTVALIKPDVSIGANPQTIQSGSSTNLTWTSNNAASLYIDNGIGLVADNGTKTVSPTVTTTYTLTGTGPLGTANSKVTVYVTTTPDPAPPGTFEDQYSDLIPPDTTIKKYDASRFAIVRGTVNDKDKNPLSQVSVKVFGNSKYGTALSDSKGQFSIPVDINGTINFTFIKDGYITSHRQISVTPNDIAIIDPITMLSEDTKSTSVTLDGIATNVTVHQSSPVTDVSGTRSANVVISGDNRAYAVDENGKDMFELSKLNLRATEFKTPESMPAVLPPTSAFTYCVELKADGVDRIRFKDPVVVFVDNFLGFNVGEIVPVGYYDRDRGVWVPSANGRVVKLLDLNGDGIVDALDANGDGKPDDLNGNGDFSDEVKGLNDPAKYKPGQTYWRVSLTHFTPWDLNWPSILKGATPANASGLPNLDQQKEVTLDCNQYFNSFINCRSRIYHEDINLPGTDLTLHYASNRVPDFKTIITVPASGSTIPAELKGINVKLYIAGRSFEQNLPVLPNQTAQFSWDGLDFLGHVVNSASANIKINFLYDQIYSGFENANNTPAFGQPGVTITKIPGRSSSSITKSFNLAVENQSKSHEVLAQGWTLSNQHFLSSGEVNILYKGNGDIISSGGSTIISTIAGGKTKFYGSNGDGGPAIGARVISPVNVEIDQKGNIYIAEPLRYYIRKVDTNGIITTFAGKEVEFGFSGDGGLATSAKLDHPQDIAVDKNGNVYIADTYNNRIRKIDLNGIITTIAGTGIQGFSGDGGPAINAKLSSPQSLDIDQNGNIYIADFTNYRIRKIDTNGIITTVAGSGISGYSGDGGPAIKAGLIPYSLGVDQNGNIYFVEYDAYSIRKIDSMGIITTIAGTGVWGYNGDEKLATEAYLGHPLGVAVDQNGNVYIADTFNNRIRKVNPNGIITTIAGNGNPDFSGDGGPATSASLWGPFGVSVDFNGNIYIADEGNNRIRKLKVSALSFNNPSAVMTFAEEGLGYLFSSDGKHKQTLDLDTQKVIEQFGYDASNRLISSTDLFGNKISIERNGAGVPTAIVSPDGLRTNLTIDANNQLTKIIYPDGNSYNFQYTAGGLLTKKTDPKGNTFTHVYDATGRITDVSDQEGGHDQFSHQVADNTADVTTKVTTAEGNVTTYLDQTASTGALTSTSSITGVTNKTVYTRTADELTSKTVMPDSTIIDQHLDLDPANLFTYPQSQTITTPAGLKAQIVNGRTYQDTNNDQKTDLITRTTSLNGKTSTVKHNLLTSTITATSPLNRTINSIYDPATLLTSKVSVPGLLDTTFAYDLKGRLNSVTTGARTMSLTYDLSGNVQTSTDPLGNRTTYDYDAVGRTTVIHRPDLTDIHFTYDQNGNMTVLTNPSNRNHGYIYNKVNLATSYKPPLSAATQYVYDKERRLKEVDFPSGKQIKNIFTGVLLTRTQTPEGNIDLSYLPSGQLGTIAKGGETITNTYDGMLLKTVTSAGTLAQTLSLTYNNDLKITGLNYAGALNNFGYDNDGLLTSSGRFTVTRNAQNGLPTTVTGGALNLSRTFDGYGELTNQTQTVNGNAANAWTLTYNNNGQIATKSETVSGTTANYEYTYDSVGRLTQVKKDGVLVEEYHYTGADPLGTRTWEMNSLRGIAGRNLTYNEEDQLLNVGTASYQYSADGFLTKKTDGSDVTNYNYSSRGELLSVNLPGGQIIEYVYDPLGRRIAKKVNGTITEKYLWAGLTQLLAVYDGSNNLLMRFEYSDGIVPNVMTKGASTYYMTYDQVGSLRGVFDSTGNIVKRIDYDSFGNILADTAPAFTVPYGFAGGLQDRDTGLVHFGFRDYDPATGRWTAKDPIEFDGGDTDLYGYVLNDPVNLVDILGFSSICAIKKALKTVHEIVGKLPKGKKGKWGSPQRGTSKKGYRLDPAHPNREAGSGEDVAHINWWDYTNGKRGKGGKSGSVILGAILVYLGDFLDPFDADALDDEADLNVRYGIISEESDCEINSCINK